MARRSNINHYIVLVLFVLLPLIANAAGNGGITYHGRILRPNGTPVDSTTTEFKLQIRTPDTSDCLLYEETKLLNMSSSNGAFSLTINDGNGTRTTGSYALNAVFSNRSTFTVTAPQLDCGTTNVYTPSAYDGRKFVVYFRESGGSAWEKLPAQDINYVPQALEAIKVGGFGPGDLMRFNHADSETVNAFTFTDYGNLVKLLAGTTSLASNQVLSWNGTSWSGITPVTTELDPTVKAFAKNDLPACTTGQVLSVVSGALTCVTDATGGAPVDATTSSKGVVQVGSGLAVSAGVISLGNVGTANTYVKVVTDATGRVTSGQSSLSDSDLNQITTGGKVSGTAITSGDINTTGAYTSTNNISTSGTLTATTAVRSKDLQIFDGGSHYLHMTVPTLAADYTLTWPAALPGSNKILQTNSTGTLSWVDASASSQWTTGSGLIYYNSGNVGIGTTSAASRLTVPWISGDTTPTASFGTSNLSNDQVAVSASSWSAAAISANSVSGSAISASTTSGNGLNATSSSGYGVVATSQSGTGIYAQSSSASSAWFVSSSASNTAPTVKIQRQGTSTANLQEWQNASGTAVSVVDSTGRIGIGTTSPNTTLDVGGSISAQGDLRLQGSSGSYAGFRAPSSAPNQTWVLPTTVGSANQVLQTDGSGNLSWVNVTASGYSGVLPIANGGTNNSVALNNNRLMYSSGGKIAEMAAMTDGQVVVGVSSGTPTAVGFSGDVALNNAGVTAVNRIKGTSVSATPTMPGQVLRYDGSSYTPNFVGMTDLRSKITGAKQLEASCDNKSTLTYNSVNDDLTCSPISLPLSQTTGTLGVANGGTGLTSGTIGGIPYFSGATTLTSSPALTQYQVVLGGGTTAPTTVSGTGSTGQVLTSNGAGAVPTWQAAATSSQWVTATPNISFTAGNVGIGTTAGSNALQVQGNIRAGYGDQNQVYLGTGSGASALGYSTSYIGFNASRDSGNWSMATDGAHNGGSTIYGNINGSMFFATIPNSATPTANQTQTDTQVASRIRMVVDSSGSVGIGTTLPGAGLDVANGASLWLRDSNNAHHHLAVKLTDAVGVDYATNYGYLSFSTSAIADGTPTEKVRIDKNGKVGIGTTSPAQPLDVVGNAQVSGSLAMSAAGEMLAAVNGQILTVTPTATNKTSYFALAPTGSSTLSEIELGGDNNFGGSSNYGFLSQNGADMSIGTNSSTGTFTIFSNARTVASVSVLSSGRVGIGSTSPNSVLQVGGAISVPVKAVTTAYTIQSTDSIVTVNATSSAFTVTLPTAVGITGRQYSIKKSDSSSNVVTVAGTSAQTIDGSASTTLSSQYQFITLVSDGANWMILGGTGTASGSSCTHGSATFAYTGSMQAFVVPANCGTLTVKIWGAGGSGGSANKGGGGGYVTGILAAIPGESLNVMVGQGGPAPTNTYYGGNGGGLSAILRSTSYLAAAGGGGGGSGAGSGSCASQVGGGGGGVTGTAGLPASGQSGGGGGTASAGGTAGYSNYDGGYTGQAGSSYKGGNGETSLGVTVYGFGGSGGSGSSGNGGAAGGGGGYYGGGGGAQGDVTSCGGSGGGGSSYATALSSGTTTGATGDVPGNNTDSDLITGYALGGGSMGVGGNGYVKITY